MPEVNGCPGTRAASELLADHPDLSVGVLTLTADLPAVPWAPLTGGRSIQHHGRLLGIEQREQLLAQAVTTEGEAELRAQVEALLAAGPRPTHLDRRRLADGSDVRSTDRDVLMSPRTRTALREEAAAPARRLPSSRVDDVGGDLGRRDQAQGHGG